MVVSKYSLDKILVISNYYFLLYQKLKNAKFFLKKLETETQNQLSNPSSFAPNNRTKKKFHLIRSKIKPKTKT